MEKYYYLALTPTNTGLVFIYSKLIWISYTEQTAKEDEFRRLNGNPSNYNAQWSIGYEDERTANSNRSSEISALQNAGHVVKTQNWTL